MEVPLNTVKVNLFLRHICDLLGEVALSQKSQSKIGTLACFDFFLGLIWIRFSSQSKAFFNIVFGLFSKVNHI